MTLDSKMIRFTIVDTPNHNNRMYPADVMLAAFEKFKDAPIMGHLGQPPDGNVHLGMVSHTISNPRIENGFAVGDLAILDTPEGQRLKDLLATGAKVDYRMTGTGRPWPPEDGKPWHTISDYTLVSVDAVQAEQS